MSVVLDQTLLTQGSSTLYLVQGDTSPPLVVSIRNEVVNQVSGASTTAPVDISQSIVKLKIRRKGMTEIHDEIIGLPITGVELPNGSIDTSYPYDIPGVGGRVAFFWHDNTLSFAGDAEAEIEISGTDGRIQTSYNLLRFRVRPQF